MWQVVRGQCGMSVGKFAIVFMTTMYSPVIKRLQLFRSYKLIFRATLRTDTYHGELQPGF